MKFELNEQVLNNLKAFLLRVDMKGSEVPSYVEIINALQSPLQEDVENK